MALRKFLTFAVLALSLTAALASSVLAQQTGSTGAQDEQQQQGREGKRVRRGRGHGFGLLRGLRELNLSDAQREQVRAIFTRFAETIRPQREQLQQLREQKRDGNVTADVRERAQALRAQIDEYEKAMRVEILGVLTPEQRTRFEAMEQERKTRRDEMRRRRQSAQPNTK